MAPVSGTRTHWKAANGLTFRQVTVWLRGPRCHDRGPASCTRMCVLVVTAPCQAESYIHGRSLTWSQRCQGNVSSVAHHSISMNWQQMVQKLPVFLLAVRDGPNYAESQPEQWLGDECTPAVGDQWMLLRGGSGRNGSFQGWSSSSMKRIVFMFIILITQLSQFLIGELLLF